MSNDRMARTLQSASKAFEAVELLKTKLENMVNSIVSTSTTAKDTGRLSGDEQLAVRTIRSRQRQLDREWLASYGTGQARQMAMIELSLARQDDGSLIRIGEKLHGVGRMSCKACATTMNGLPFPVPSARLCTVCKQGVQHAFDTIENGPGSRATVDMPTMVPEAGQPTGIPVVVRHYCCDSCGSASTEVM